MPTDTSQPADRVRFEALIAGVGTCNMAVAQAVQNCPLPVTEITAGLLGLGYPCTFAQAAALVMLRLNTGSPF